MKKYQRNWVRRLIKLSEFLPLRLFQQHLANYIFFICIKQFKLNFLLNINQKHPNWNTYSFPLINFIVYCKSVSGCLMEFLILLIWLIFSENFVCSVFCLLIVCITIVEQCNLFEIQLEDPHEFNLAWLYLVCIPLLKVLVSHVGLFINK